MTENNNSRLGKSVFIVIGVVALIIGGWQGLSVLQFMSHARSVTGHVVAVPGQESATQSSAHPMIVFSAANGTLVRYRQNGMGSRPIGAAIDLLYDPAAPADTAVARGFWTQWFPAIGPFLLGLAFIALPLLGVEIGMRGARP